MTVLLLSKYDSIGASSRIRSLQFLPYIERFGVEVRVAPLFSNRYLKALYAGSSRWSIVITAYARRAMVMLVARRFDVIWIEKEIFPFFPAWIESALYASRTRYLVDYDDAIFHRYDHHKLAVVRWILGQKIDTVMRKSGSVVVGNDYLASRARRAKAPHIVKIPSVVDLTTYMARPRSPAKTLTVGWIGSPSTSKYLLSFIDVVEAAARQYPLRFVAVGADPRIVLSKEIEVVPWSEESEVSMIQEFDIGIMPLPDLPWERGKCGYKLIQCMACGVPVIASPVGVNSRIVVHGVNGYLCSTTKEWLLAFEMLSNDAILRARLGAAARATIEHTYSVQKQRRVLLGELRRVSSERSPSNGRQY